MVDTDRSKLLGGHDPEAASINRGPPNSSEVDALMFGGPSTEGIQEEHRIECTRSQATNKTLANLAPSNDGASSDVDGLRAAVKGDPQE